MPLDHFRHEKTGMQQLERSFEVSMSQVKIRARVDRYAHCGPFMGCLSRAAMVLIITVSKRVLLSPSA